MPVTEKEITIMRKTKIICTIGPATASYPMLEKLAHAGMDVVRLNMSHGDHESAAAVIKSIKTLNKKIPYPVAILMDTQGPEIRTGDLVNDLELKNGSEISITVRDSVDVERSSIHIHYDDLIETVSVGDRITVDNGIINLQVLEKQSDGIMRCRVIDGGILKSKRHVNLPGIRVNLPAITKKDKEDILFALEQQVDFIALSFVREAADVRELRELMGEKAGKIKIISKIEDQEGLSNIDEITQCSDGVMVARGDLGIETDLSDLPNIQRKIMSKCAKYGKRSIVATHLLESMINNPTPTRAEVTDVANAIYEGADAVMLSGETTIGSYPVECVKFIKRIADKTEKYRTLGYEDKLIATTDWQHLGIAAKTIAQSIEADGIIAITRSGTTAEIVSNAKPYRMPVFAFSNNKKTLQHLSLAGSVNAYYTSLPKDHEKNISGILSFLKKELNPKKRMKFVVISGILSESSADAIEIRNL